MLQRILLELVYVCDNSVMRKNIFTFIPHPRLDMSAADVIRLIEPGEEKSTWKISLQRSPNVLSVTA
jgi:hypothetical protein